MDTDFKKYVKPSQALTVFAVLFIVLALVCGVVALTSSRSSKDEAEFFYAFDDEGYVYLDVVGISDWIVSSDSSYYYIAVNADNYLYIVRTSQSTRNKMTEQITFWNDEDAQPVVKYLFGTAEKIPADLKENIMDVVGYTSEEFDDYLGNRYLHEGVTPEQGMVATFSIMGIFFAIFGITFLFTSKSRNSFYKKTLAQIEAEFSEGKYETDFADAQILGRVRNAKFGPKNLYVKKQGIAVSYSEVAWIYLRIQRVNFVPTNATICLAIKGRKEPVALVVPYKERESYLDDVISIVQTQNPSVMLGYTNDNAKAFKQMNKL